ncbi:hypothetical protein FRC03_002533 [Tulasnella sp. 419]|nr:hypothetical protein FRC03_002533 [Tulasnella sp. 419]
MPVRLQDTTTRLDTIPDPSDTTAQTTAPRHELHSDSTKTRELPTTGFRGRGNLLQYTSSQLHGPPHVHIYTTSSTTSENAKYKEMLYYRHLQLRCVASS